MERNKEILEILKTKKKFYLENNVSDETKINRDCSIIVALIEGRILSSKFTHNGDIVIRYDFSTNCVLYYPKLMDNINDTLECMMGILVSNDKCKFMLEKHINNYLLKNGTQYGIKIMEIINHERITVRVIVND